MKLNKENYEFLMFELLEGNLEEADKNDLLEQIKTDAFYKQEWTLMQHSVAFPDKDILFANKQSMMKPTGKIISFVYFNTFAKIAASLLLIGIVGWWYVANDKTPEVVNSNIKPNIPEEIIVSPHAEIKMEETQNNDEHLAVKFNPTNQVKNNERQPLIFVKEVIDSALPEAIPEILLLKPVQKNGIAYEISPNLVAPSGILIMEQPKTKDLNKIGQFLVQADNVRNTVKEYWNDIPNLKLKVTPKFKNNKRSIDFELKGETIYANALVEIK